MAFAAKPFVAVCAMLLCANAEGVLKGAIDDVVGNVTDTAGDAANVVTGDFKKTTFVLFASDRDASYNIANATGVLADASYDATLPTVMYMHGYMESKDSKSVVELAKAFQQRGSHNFVAVDWSPYAGPPYVAAFLGLYGVSSAVGEAIQSIVDAGLPEDKLWLIGHSLGGQMAGLVSRKLDFLPTRLTALDPALPGYNIPGFPSLTQNDAALVDVIHTDAGVFGYNENCGDVDLWPNGGHPLQPGCPELVDPLFCSHHRSWKFFLESLLSEAAFPAVLCSSWKDFKSGACPANASNVVYLGYNAAAASAANLTGSFYLTTNAQSPFARGQEGLLAPAAVESESEPGANSEESAASLTKGAAGVSPSASLPQTQTVTSGIASGISNFFKNVEDKSQTFFRNLFR